MASYVNRQYWITQGKRLIQSVYRRCTKCLRYNGNSMPQQMLDHLLSELIEVGRGCTSIKGYVAIFICMVTLAVHLEIVSDLTTAAILAPYRQFTARRGNCNTIYGDNATTFHSAATEFKGLFSATSSLCEECL